LLACVLALRSTTLDSMSITASPAARQPASSGRAAPWLPWAALLVVYLVWGSTYLAIRVGVETIPPLLLSAVRYLVAGAVLYPVAVQGSVIAALCPAFGCG